MRESHRPPNYHQTEKSKAARAHRESLQYSELPDHTIAVLLSLYKLSNALAHFAHAFVRRGMCTNTCDTKLRYPHGSKLSTYTHETPALFSSGVSMHMFWCLVTLIRQPAKIPRGCEATESCHHCSVRFGEVGVPPFAFGLLPKDFNVPPAATLNPTVFPDIETLLARRVDGAPFPPA